MSTARPQPEDRFLVRCVAGGEDCYSSGFFRTLDEARFEMSMVSFFACPECGRPLTIDTVKAAAAA